MSDEQLKPCPFCLHVPSHHNALISGVVQHDYNKCICAGAIMRPAQWNTRPIEDALMAEKSEAEEIGRRWLQNSALEEWFPFDAEELTKVKDQLVHALSEVVRVHRANKRHEETIDSLKRKNEELKELLRRGIDVARNYEALYDAVKDAKEALSQKEGNDK